jgi:formylglycine-generating enzyme
MKWCLSLFLALAVPLCAQAVTISTVPVGNPNNPFELQPQGIFGQVATSYRIGVTEVTNTQYAEFLNAVADTDTYGLYDSNMGFSTKGGILRTGSSGNYNYTVKSPVPGVGPGGTAYSYGDKPVVYVSWYDAVRFTNWLHNSQGNGSTETGAYTLLGGTATPSNADSITRSAGATWFLPTENEWYKAAYYDGTAGVYYDYPAGADALPNNNLPTSDNGNSANFLQEDPETDPDNTTGSLDYPFTAVGAYALSESPYGTRDQAGNVWEWNQTLLGSGLRGRRGGAWSSEQSTLNAAHQDSFAASFQTDSVGFRVATVATSSPLAGDFDNDGKVDASDYVVWRKTIGTPAGYTQWRTNFGRVASGSGSASSSSIPEPASGVLFLFGAIFALRRRRRNLAS